MKTFIKLIIGCTLLIAFGCSEDEGPSCFKCIYEERKTSCSSSGFGNWEAGSSEHDESTIRNDLNPQSFCELVYPSSDLECQANCCINFQFRNVQAVDCD